MGILVLSFIITSVLVAFGFYIYFKKIRHKTSPLNHPAYWIASIFTIPIFYAGVLFIWFSSSSTYEKQLFDKVDWTKNRDSRYIYTDDLIDKKKLLGLTTTDIENMLGVADYHDDTLMVYYIGYSPSVFLNMDPDWLEATVTDGKISNALIRH